MKCDYWDLPCCDGCDRLKKNNNFCPYESDPSKCPSIKKTLRVAEQKEQAWDKIVRSIEKYSERFEIPKHEIVADLRHQFTYGLSPDELERLK